mgnify:CR=1 FL=1
MSDDANLIERFLEMLVAETGASQHTLSAYRTDLEQASAITGGKLSGAGKDQEFVRSLAKFAKQHRRSQIFEPAALFWISR